MPPSNSTDTVDFSSITHKNDLELISLDSYRKYIPRVIVVFLLIAVLSIAIRNGVLIALFLSVIVGLGASRIHANKQAVLQRFARDNNWSFTGTAYTEAPLGIRWAGHSIKQHSAVTGSFFDTFFVLYLHEYTTGSGKNATKHVTTVIEFQLETTFPYMLLDSRQNDAGAAFIPSRAKKLSLEGDFDAHFQLYAFTGSEIDVLSIITPDVMRTALEASGRYDIEVFKDKLYLYVEGDQRRLNTIRQLFYGSEKILSELKHRARTYRQNVDICNLTIDDMQSIRPFFGVSQSAKSRSAFNATLPQLLIGAVIACTLIGFIAVAFSPTLYEAVRLFLTAQT